MSKCIRTETNTRQSITEGREDLNPLAERALTLIEEQLPISIAMHQTGVSSLLVQTLAGIAGSSLSGNSNKYSDGPVGADCCR